jgi:hypothetical protein
MNNFKPGLTFILALALAAPAFALDQEAQNLPETMAASEIEIDFAAAAEMKSQIELKLAEIAKVEKQIVNHELVYDLGDVGAWISSTMAITGFGLGRHQGSIVGTTDPKNPLAKTKYNLKMAPGPKRVMIGSILAVIMSQAVQKYANNKIFWTDAEKEILERQLKNMNEKLDHILAGREQLEMDPFDLLEPEAFE